MMSEYQENDKQDKPSGKAVQRYRRVKTIAKKAVETADLCGLQMNVLVYDPKMKRFREFYTTPDMKLEAIFQIPEDVFDASSSEAKFQNIKFKSIDARLNYVEDVDYEIGFPFQKTLDQLARMKEELSLLEQKLDSLPENVDKRLLDQCHGQQLDLSSLGHEPITSVTLDDISSESSQCSVLRSNTSSLAEEPEPVMKRLKLDIDDDQVESAQAMFPAFLFATTQDQGIAYPKSKKLKKYESKEGCLTWVINRRSSLEQALAARVPPCGDDNFFPRFMNSNVNEDVGMHGRTSNRDGRDYLAEFDKFDLI